jgi:hypothetical protein
MLKDRDRNGQYKRTGRNKVLSPPREGKEHQRRVVLDDGVMSPSSKTERWGSPRIAYFEPVSSGTT